MKTPSNRRRSDGGRLCVYSVGRFCVCDSRRCQGDTREKIFSPVPVDNGHRLCLCFIPFAQDPLQPPQRLSDGTTEAGAVGKPENGGSDRENDVDPDPEAGSEAGDSDSDSHGSGAEGARRLRSDYKHLLDVAKKQEICVCTAHRTFEEINPQYAEPQIHGTRVLMHVDNLVVCVDRAHLAT